MAPSDVVSSAVWVAQRAFLHNGHRTDYLPKSNREATRVSKLLSSALGGPIPVRGVVVVICDHFTLKAQPTDVSVVPRRVLRAWLERQPVVLGPDDVGTIASVASRPQTWQ